MGYYIRKLAGKRNWKLQYVSYRKKDSEGFLCKLPQRAWDIPKERYFLLGFRESMTYQQARSRQLQLNTQSELKRFEEIRIASKKVQKQHRMEWNSYLPGSMTRDFERRFVYPRFGRDNERLTSREGAWKAAQKLMLELKIEPWCWHEEVFWIYEVS